MGELEEGAIRTDALDEGEEGREEQLSPREQMMAQIAANREAQLNEAAGEAVEEVPEKSTATELELQTDRKIPVKIDGEETEIPLSELVKGFQKDATASRRLEEAANQRKELDAREQELNAREAQIAQQIAAPAAADDGAGDEVDAALDAYLEGDTTKIRELLKGATKGRAESSTPIPNEELDRLVEQKLAKRETDREHETATATFKKDYKEIFEDPDLLAAANKRFFAKIEEGKSISDAMSEAGKETKEWLAEKAGVKPGNTRDDKLQRKGNLVNLPRAGARTAPADDLDNAPQDRSSVIAEMQKARGKQV
jgi:hypothetical protein